MTKRIDSYDSNAKLPKAGSRWVWEIDKPHARELIEVVETLWNGEEWWVRTCSLLPGEFPSDTPTNLNDLSRFWEAVTPVGGGTHGLTEHRIPPPVSDA
jgi:hypothetical protein